MNPLTPYLMMGKLIALLGAIAIICAQASIIHKWHTQSDGNAAKAEALSLQLETLAQQSQQKQRGVAKVIDHYLAVTKPEIRTKIERIETAPLPGNCRTPKEILNADL